MRIVLLILIPLVIIFSCSQHNHNKPEPYEYTIKGTVIGMDTGKIFFSESSRIGDEIFIPVNNGKFSYTGKSFDIFSSG